MKRRLMWSGRYEGYSLESFRKDLVSGIVVGIIAIPLGMAFAIASGVKPEYGIYTTIVAGLLISLFGGSRHQIGGPTGAFIPILFAIVMQYGYENLLIAGILAGVLLLLMGIFRLGMLMKYFPRPVTVGFTTGIAVIIFTGQIASFLGLSGVEKHESFVMNMREIFIHLDTVQPASIIVAAISLAAILLAPRLNRRLPGPLFGLIASSAAAALLFPGQVATIGSTYGAIPAGLPELHVPQITLDRILSLLPPALAIAMLGGIESLLSAVVADGMTGRRHHSNRELIGQGVANIVTPLFGGIPATGAIARTAANIRSGAVSPIAGIIHSLTVLAVLLVFAPYASHIPLAGMAPILMLVAWNMSERKPFWRVLRTKTSDSFVLLATFLLTVFINLTAAVGIGLVLAVALFVKRMSELLHVAKVLPDPDDKREKLSSRAVHGLRDCPQVSIVTVDGPLFFGAADEFEREIEAKLRGKPNVLLLRMSRVPLIDTTGESRLSALIRQHKGNGGAVLVSGLRSQPKEMLEKTGLYAIIGESSFYERTGDAINAALKLLDRPRCVGCKHFAFRECRELCQPATALIPEKAGLFLERSVQ